MLGEVEEVVDEVEEHNRAVSALLNKLLALVENRGPFFQLFILKTKDLISIIRR